MTDVAPRHYLVGLLAFAFIVLFTGWFETAAHLASLVTSLYAFSHGIWVPVVSVVLIWRDRRYLSSIPLAIWWPGLLAFVATNLVWLLGAAAEAKIVQHLALVGAIQCVVAGIMGRALYRAMLFPMLFLFLVIPVGEGLVAPLQVFSAKAVIWMLDISGISFKADGVLIELSSGLYEVAEACAGVKFLFTSVVMGVLLCHLAFKSWRRRAVMLLAAILVPIFANVIRIYTILLISEVTDQSFAKGVDHVVYGWGFLSVVLLILIMGAYHYSDRGDGEIVPEASETVQTQMPSRAKLGVGTLVALMPLLTSAWVAAVPNGDLAACLPAEWSPRDCPDCGYRKLSNDAGAGWMMPLGADRASFWAYRLDARQVWGAGAVYAPDRAAHRAAISMILALGPRWELQAGLTSGHVEAAGAAFEEHIIRRGGERRLVWRTFYVDGKFHATPLEAKVAMAALRLQGKPATVRMLAVATDFDGDLTIGREALGNFISTFSVDRLLWGADTSLGDSAVCAG